MWYQYAQSESASQTSERCPATGIHALLHQCTPGRIGHRAGWVADDISCIGWCMRWVDWRCMLSAGLHSVASPKPAWWWLASAWRGSAARRGSLLGLRRYLSGLSNGGSSVHLCLHLRLGAIRCPLSRVQVDIVTRDARAVGVRGAPVRGHRGKQRRGTAHAKGAPARHRLGGRRPAA